MFEHVGDDPAEQLAADLEAGVGVDLDQPHLELLVDHEVQPEDLEVVLQAAGVQLQEGGLNRVGGDGPHLGVDVFGEAAAALAVLLVEVALELVVGELVTLLVLAVEGAVLLDGVVGEVDELIADVVEVEVVGGGADVALAEPVGAHEAVQAGDQHVVADVELPPLVQQRVLDVLLDDVGLVVAVLVLLLLLEDVVQLVDLLNHHDAVAAVRQLPRLHDPDVLQPPPPLLLLRPLLLVLLALDLLELLGEPHVFGVVHSFLDVEGERDDLEDVLLAQLVVALEVVVEGLLVADEVVELQVVVHQLLRLVLPARLQVVGLEVLQPVAVLAHPVRHLAAHDARLVQLVVVLVHVGEDLVLICRQGRLEASFRLLLGHVLC